MSEEEKKLLAEEQAKAAAQAAITTPPDAIKKELEQAQYTIVKLKKELDSRQATPQVDVEAIKAEAARIALEQIEKAKTDLAKDTFEEELSRIAKSDEEKQLILKQYNEGIIKTGISRASIINDLARAALLANAPKMQAQIEEIKKSAISQDSLRGGNPTGTPTINLSDKKLSPQEEKWVLDTARATGKTADEVKALLLKNMTRNNY
jgi:hypothetical protein